MLLRSVHWRLSIDIVFFSILFGIVTGNIYIYIYIFSFIKLLNELSYKVWRVFFLRKQRKLLKKHYVNGARLKKLLITYNMKHNSSTSIEKHFDEEVDLEDALDEENFWLILLYTSERMCFARVYISMINSSEK